MSKVYVYRTTDEVNQWFTRTIVASCGENYLDQRGSLPTGSTNYRMLIDLDHPPFGDLSREIGSLLDHSWTVPVAAHAYTMGDLDVRALSGAGISVFSHVENALVHLGLRIPRSLDEAWFSDNWGTPLQRLTSDWIPQELESLLIRPHQPAYYASGTQISMPPRPV